MGWKARKIRKVQEISPQIPIHHVRVRSIRPCSFPLKWRSGLTKFPIGTPRPQTNVSASLHLSHSTIISVPAPISTIHIISINKARCRTFAFSIICRISIIFVTSRSFLLIDKYLKNRTRFLLFQILKIYNLEFIVPVFPYR